MLFSTLMDIKADRTLIFCNSIQVVKKINKMLKYAKFTVFALHSDMEMVERFNLFEKFQNSRSAILIGKEMGLPRENIYLQPSASSHGCCRQRNELFSGSCDKFPCS
jgi:superfamily II DNA helicase RecQ